MFLQQYVSLCNITYNLEFEGAITISTRKTKTNKYLFLFSIICLTKYFFNVLNQINSLGNIFIIIFFRVLSKFWMLLFYFSFFFRYNNISFTQNHMYSPSTRVRALKIEKKNNVLDYLSMLIRGEKI